MALDDEGMRTMFIGLFLGMVFYAVGLASRTLLPEPWNLNLWMVFTVLGLITLVGWFIAVQRGFRIRRFGRVKTRATRRRKDRERQAPPPWLRR